MKLLLLLLYVLSVILLTNAVEVTDEDINSPLVSYLLAKVQQLEAKMIAKPNLRNTREVERRSVDTNTSADDKKTKDCPQQVITYIRWGNTTCPYGANTIYKGIAVGGRHDFRSPSDMMCLPPNLMHYPTNVGGSATVHAVEYRVTGSIDHVNCRNIPCALCEATGRGDKIMIPSHYVCPDGWHKEYNGYIMAGADRNEGGSMYHCIDQDLEVVKGHGFCGTIKHLHTATRGGYALSCVICTK